MSGAGAARSLAFRFGLPLAHARLSHKCLILFSICSILDKQNDFVNDFSEIRDCEAFGKAE
jgi:hypothetical protein